MHGYFYVGNMRCNPLLIVWHTWYFHSGLNKFLILRIYRLLIFFINLHLCRELRSRIIQMQTIYKWHLEVNSGCLFGLSFQKTDIWWVVCIAICCNVRKGLRKEIAGTYLNLALYFCVFSKYLRNCADTMSPPYLFTYWNATSLNYVNVCWVMALTVTNFSICQWSFKWLLKFF